jgi:hypothetical protein
MAILQGLPGVELNILVNGEMLEEWTDNNEVDQTDGHNHVTKYVESTPGANFAVQYKVTEEYFDHHHENLRFVFFIDGNEVGRKLVRTTRIPMIKRAEGTFVSLAGANNFRRFNFIKLVKSTCNFASPDTPNNRCRRNKRASTSRCRPRESYSTPGKHPSSRVSDEKSKARRSEDNIQRVG